MSGDLIDHLFAKLTVRYGDSWMNKWKGIDVDAVKNDWRQQLQGVSRGQMASALDNLPERPPNIMQFKRLCWEAPRPTPIALPPPRASSPEERAKVREILQGVKDRLVRSKLVGGER